jgi:hypothetical protein
MSAEKEKPTGKGIARITASCPNPNCQEQIVAVVPFELPGGKNGGCKCNSCQQELDVCFQDPKDGHPTLILTPKSPGSILTA